MIRRYFSGSLLASAISLAAPAMAQNSPPEPDSGEIVIEGNRQRDREIRDFVRALTDDVPMQGQLSRFEWAVCPAAIGLAPAQNAAIVRRMRRVAEAAEIPVAGADCTPNVFVIVADNKRELIQGLRREHRAFFSGLSPHTVRRLLRGSEPAAAWQVEGRLNEDGLQVPRDPHTGIYVNEMIGDASRLRAPTHPHFIASLVVIELDALAGLTTTQVADYAAMRAFARTEPSRLEGSNAPTILTVLDAPMGSPVPVTLTQWDLSYLKGLYTTNNSHYAVHQRHEMRDAIEDELDRAQRADE